jgi:hypothetical protein
VIKSLVQGAHGAQTQATLLLQNLGRTPTSSKFSKQVGGGEPFLLHAEPNGLDGIHPRHRMLRFLVRMDERHDHFEAIALRAARPNGAAHALLDLRTRAGERFASKDRIPFIALRRPEACAPESPNPQL